MHPSLMISLSNCSRLPSALRMRAVAVARGSEVETIALLAGLGSTAPEHLPLLVPAFCAALISTRIPRILARFDSSGWMSIRSDIVQVHFCLNGISDLGALKAIPSSAFVDLWKIVWPWIEFLDEYEESLCGDNLLRDAFDGANRYTGFLVLICVLRNSRETSEAAEKLIDSTDGLYIVVGRAWGHLIHAKDDAGLTHVSYFLGLWLPSVNVNSPAFHDLISGTGGTQTDLASIVVSHIKRVFPSPHSPVTRDSNLHLAAALPIATCEGVTGSSDPAFQRTLLSCGIVPALTIAFRALCHSPLGTMETVVLKEFFLLLLDQISSFPQMWLPQSLHVGLLEILFTTHNREAISPSFVAFIKDVLSPATVYHSVVVQLEISLPHVLGRDAAAIFSDAPLVALWESFLRMIASRIRLREEYCKGTLTATRECHDLECARIRPKEQVKRCTSDRHGPPAGPRALTRTRTRKNPYPWSRVRVFRQVGG
ncbi:hypothetical protein C8R45DRAFT_1072542 [Mycena sanguinolenta]|nr:hypothetical protein C8R45DRAFT_1072542 [Mycena sanguinolenta]